MKIAPFKLERFFAKYEFKAPYLLCASDCESLPLGDLLAMEPDAEEALRQLWLGYTDSPGDPNLRAEIADLYDSITPEEVLVHTGAEEAIFIFMNTALQPGDHVIVHAPCYQSLAEVARAAGCKVTRWEGDPANGWDLDLDFLRKKIGPKTKAVVVNSPHNPTGYLMSREKQAALVDIAREHGLILFFDEVYRCLEHDEADRLPAACDLYENAVSLGVMSKAYGLAGLRIGWIATRNREVYEAMATFKDYTTICNSAPSEFLAALALRHKDQLIWRNLDIIHENLALLDDFFADYEDIFAWKRPRAGSVAFPALRLDQDVETFCADLVERQGVILAPGSHFDYAGGHFRIGFGRKNLPECVEQFERYMRRTFRSG